MFKGIPNAGRLRRFSQALAAALILVAMGGIGQVFAQDGPFGKQKSTASSTENSSGDSGKTPEKKPGNNKPAKVDLDPKESPDARLAKAWKAFFDGKASEALQFAESLVKAQPTTLALEAKHLCARCNWALGQAIIDSAVEDDAKAVAASRQQAGKYLAEARKIWKELASSTAAANVKRQSIAAALELAAKDKLDEACDELNKVLSAEIADTCTCEAGILYAEIRVRQGQIKDALRACKYATDFGGRLPAGNEITLAAVRPFLDAAAALERKLKTEPAALAFATAERLRMQKKFTQAISAYENICKDFPETDFAPRSRFSAGLCHLGLEKPADAIAYWKAFIKEEPSGPWRGQSYIGITDTNLEQIFEPAEAMATADEAGKSLDSALADKKSSPSWSPIRFDILFRSGMLAYAQDKFDDASERLATAQKAADVLDDEGKAGLGRLIEGAKNKSWVIPPSVRNVAEPRIDLLLAVGSMYNIVHKTRDGERYFDLALAELAKTSASKSSMIIAEQKSCAYRGKAVSQHLRREWEPAIKGYNTALETFPKATWHDYTLHMAGLTVLQQAQEKFYKAVQAATHRKITQNAEEQKKDAAARDEALKTHNKERLASLPYYERLIKDFPKSEYADSAHYCVGIFTYEGGNREQGYKLLDAFVTACPETPCTGEALLVLSRHDLEYLADRDKANTHLDKLNTWAEATRAKGISPAKFAPDPVGMMSYKKPEKDGTGVWKTSADSEQDNRPLYDFLTLQDCHAADWYLNELQSHVAMFKGFILYYDGKLEDARNEFNRLAEIDPEKVARGAAFYAGAYHSLMLACDQKYMLATPEEMQNFKDRQRLAIMLGDLYYGIGQNNRSIAITHRLLDGEFGRLSEPCRQYAQFLLGMNVAMTDGRRVALEEMFKVFKDLKSLSGKNVTYTMDRAAYCAGHAAFLCYDKKSVELAGQIWKALVDSGRKNEQTMRALIGLAAIANKCGREDEAIGILENFPDDVPKMKECAAAFLDSIKSSKQWAEEQDAQQNKAKDK
ncbi:MAG: hypothetical protein HZA50_14790 [Planctomycetes bacterium]|nr:hypothetical protein [Planctomycetota bacterium]